MGSTHTRQVTHDEMLAFYTMPGPFTALEASSAQVDALPADIETLVDGRRAVNMPRRSTPSLTRTSVVARSRCASSNFASPHSDRSSVA